jgi:hypothetical protein
MLSMHPDLQIGVALTRHRRRTQTIEDSVLRREASGWTAPTGVPWMALPASIAPPALRAVPGGPVRVHVPPLRLVDPPVKTPAA